MWSISYELLRFFFVLSQRGLSREETKGTSLALMGEREVRKCHSNIKKISVVRTMNKTSKLNSVFQEIIKYLDERDAVREKLVVRSRDVIKLSGNVVTYIVNRELEKATESLSELIRITEEITKELTGYPEFLHSGTSYNMLSEYVEARVLYEIVTNGEIPSFKDIGVPPVPYLQGLGDVVGELRRIVLDEIRRERFESAWKFVGFMEEIYSCLKPLDYPEAIIPGVRHKVDVARKLVDDTKYFLIDMESRHSLKNALSEAFSRKM